MSRDDIPTLSYAPGKPHPLKKRIALIGGLGAATIAVTAAGIQHFATFARPVSLGGTPPPNMITWQTQPAGNLPATQPAGDLTTRPSADTSTQTTVPAQ